MPPTNTKSFVKKTKAGRVMKVVREHYLRDDIFVGTELALPEFRGPDPGSWVLANDADSYVVVDTNVALHQIDLLAHQSVQNLIVTSVVLEECRNRSRPSYERLRLLCQDPRKKFFVFANEHHRDTYVTALPGESINDRNDRAIRVVCKFYERAVPGMKIVLLTNDRGNLQAAKRENINAASVREFAQQRAGKEPGLSDLVAPSALDDEGDKLAEKTGKRQKVSEGAKGDEKKGDAAYAKFTSFTEHLSQSAVAAGVAGGSLHQGALRTSRSSPWEGTISCDAVDAEILIIGRDAMNRAMDGDLVAVRPFPPTAFRLCDCPHKTDISLFCIRCDYYPSASGGNHPLCCPPRAATATGTRRTTRWTCRWRREPRRRTTYRPPKTIQKAQKRRLLASWWRL